MTYPPLDSTIIRQAILKLQNKPWWEQLPIEVFSDIDSTNTHLLNLMQSPFVLLAEHQSAPRGRFLNRRFEGPRGKNICLSLSIHQDDVMQKNNSVLGLWVGFLWLCTLRSVCPTLPIALKWPNDILHAHTHEKLGGILVETQGEHVVIGIGLNVHPWKEKALLKTNNATTLSALDDSISWDRNELVALFLFQIFNALPSFSKGGFASFLNDYHDALIFERGQELLLFLPDQTQKTLRFHSIDPDGSLVVSDDSGALHRFLSADVSLKNPS